jgi:hypothetical protein
MSEMSEVYDRLRGVEIKQSAHEAVCAERYEGILRTAARMESGISSNNRILLTLGILLVSTMAGVLVKVLLG